MAYRFFFSYARETYSSSNFAGKNWLDVFFDDLCRQVAMDTGDPIEMVAYRDRDRLRISDQWGDELIQGMQETAVLVCIISPHYLKSSACGREVEMFRRRLLLNDQLGGNRHRIIPVFWADHPQCYPHMQPHVREFLDQMQFSQKELPEDYPRLGIYNFYGLGENANCFKFRKYLADRIHELSGLPTLPRLPNESKFDNLPSFFERRDNVKCERIAAGPRGTNVFYAVATRAEMAAKNPELGVAYEEDRESWRPFADKQNMPVGLATRTALSDAGQSDSEYCPLGMPNDFVGKINEARKKNSPVLIVFDRTSLEIDVIRTRLASYDEWDFPHVGLVTAGGCGDNDHFLHQVFPIKYLCGRPNHLWTVPANSDVYKGSVSDMVVALRNVVQKFSEAMIPMPQTSVPSLANVHSRS